jgi:hypothetical protein
MVAAARQEVTHVSGPRNNPFATMTRDERRAWVDEHGLPPREPGSRRWLVAPIVRPLIERLSRGAIGWSNATTTSLRIMVFVDTGYVYGERSIARFIRREIARNRLRHKRIPPGAYFSKTGRWTRNGTQLNRYESEAERRKRLWEEKTERRKQRRERAHLSQDKARRERDQRRTRRPTSDALRLVAAPTEPTLKLGTSETRVALEALIAASRAAPPAPSAPPSSAPPAPSDANNGPTWRERVEQEKNRARQWAREHVDNEPPDD